MGFQSYIGGGGQFSADLGVSCKTVEVAPFSLLLLLTMHKLQIYGSSMKRLAIIMTLVGAALLAQSCGGAEKCPAYSQVSSEKPTAKV